MTANGSELEGRPIVAVRVGPGLIADFLPTEKVAVFLFGRVDDGVVVEVDRSAALEVDFRGDPKQTIHYDGQRFVKGPLGDSGSPNLRVHGT